MPDETTVTTPAPADVSTQSAEDLSPATDDQISELLGMHFDAEPKPTPAPAPSTSERSDPSTQPRTDQNADPLAAIAGKHPPRKLDGVDPDDVKLFNEMSRPAYERLYKIYTDHKSAQQKLTEYEQKLQEPQKPGRFFDHPEAYRLSEDYQQLEQLSTQVSAVRDFWQTQLSKVEAGEAYSVLQRGQNGQLRPSAPIDPTPQAKGAIISKITQADVDLNSLSQQTRQFAADFRAQFSNHETGLKSVHDRLFGKHKEVLSPLAQKELEGFPQYFRNTPEANLLAHAVAAMRIFSEKLSEKDKELATNKANGQIAASAGPAMSTVQTGPNKSAAPFSDDEYKQMKGMFGL